MLAIIKATEAWCHYLKATPYAFEIHTDHNNSLYISKSQNLSKRQACWQQWMTRFSYQLIYKKGSQMHIADPLSRRSDHYVSSGPTPSGPWQDVTMDFTEMPESLSYNYILVVVDRFSKEVVFVSCTKEETAYSTTELFRDHVWCQHGLPSTVVSDRGSVFASNSWGSCISYCALKGRCPLRSTLRPTDKRND